jgi:hypothetical protein
MEWHLSLCTLECFALQAQRRVERFKKHAYSIIILTLVGRLSQATHARLSAVEDDKALCLS